jgi:hypothetical protein
VRLENDKGQAMGFGKKLFFVALFLSLLMETQSTSKDPWAGFAWYFHADLKSWLPQIGLAFNPLEITIVVILFAWLLRGRKNLHFRFERGLLFWPIVALTGVLVYGLLWGFVQPGSDFTKALFEVRALAYCVIAYFLVGILFTRRRDLDTLTWVILIAAFLLAIECIIRYFFFTPNHIVADLDYDHEDASVLAFALLLSVSMILLGSTRRQKLFAFASIPVDVLGMMVTHRRVGFAALAIGMIFLALCLLRVNRSLFLKIVPVTAVLFAVYLGAYWNCESGTLCQPARAISSQFNPDPRDFQSDQYRLIEKEDISLNIQLHPITGLGFGQPYGFFVPLPDESFWPFWHYTPHNEILWVWMDLGMFGFMAFWWLVGSGLYRSGRLIQALSSAGDYRARALLISSACLIIMQISVSYVDLGLTSDRAMLLFGTVLGVIGHLPGILRRSTGGDESPGIQQVEAELEKATPEAQVGILAHILARPAEAPGTRPSSTTRPRQHTRPRERARWASDDHLPPEPRYKDPTRRQTTTVFQEDSNDQLPWNTHR